MRVRRLAALAAVCAALAPLAARAAETPRIVSFTPAGVARQVVQVAAQFSEPMVAFGDPGRGPAPFQIDCAQAGSARWIDPQRWVYDFPEPLPPGLRCRFDLAAGVTTLSGRSLAGQRSFAFSTGGPSVVETDPWDGASITDDQVFLVRLDAAPDEASVLRSAVFSVSGQHDAIGVQLVPDPERAELVATLPRDARKATWLALRARQRFPADAQVALQWGPGIATPSGVETAEPQTFRFRVRPPFGVRIQCARERPKADCVPISPVRLAFSSPVPWSAARGIALVLERPGEPPLRIAAERADPEDDDPLVERVRFRGPLAAQSNYRIEIPDDLRDDAGRSLPTPSPADRVLRTAGYPPLAKFPARLGIVELHADPALPVTLRALEPDVTARLLGPEVGKTLPARSVRVAAPDGAELLGWLRRIEAASDTEPLLDASAAGVRTLAIPLAPPPALGDSDVVGIPLAGPGLHVVEIESRILGERLLDPQRPMFVAAGALVTDLAVHLAWGRDSSLVWVTSLASAAPIPGAQVRIVDCHAATLWEGTTDASGVARVDSLPSESRVERCESTSGKWSDFDSGLLVAARKDGDLGFVHSSWNRGIEAWRFQLPTVWWEETPLVGHTVFARTLLRSGETVHMKHLLRRTGMTGLEAPPAEDLPDEVLLRHAATGAEHALPVQFDSAGAAETEWKIPPAARLGTWHVFLRRAGEEASPEIETGSFRIEELRLPFMRGVLQGPAGPVVGAGTVGVDAAVHYLSGGPAANLDAELRTELRVREELPFDEEPGLEGFAFARGAVRTGIVRYGADAPCDGEACPSPVAGGDALTETRRLRLDPAGTARAEIPVDDAARPRDLAVELAWRDPAGALQTSATRLALWPASRVVGLRVDGGWTTPSSVRSVAVVLDLSGRPVAGARVALDAFVRRTYTHRRRLVGGFYAYSSAEETTALRRLCEGETDRLGRLVCDAAIDGASHVVIEARTEDDGGRTAVTHDETWLAGDDARWFEPAEGDRMDLLPEKRAWEPGETARFEVLMPFREATALVAVERSGVGEHFVTRLSGSDPVVEVPLTGAHAPNVFVSVLAVRGRAAGIQPTAAVDLGRPAYRLGIAEIQVGWMRSRLGVSVKPDREVHRVRETARVTIDVTPPEATKLPADAEVAVAAVDEALLELLPNRSWELLGAMMGRRSFGVTTATAQGLVVGKRHFGLKALPHGGGGGRRPTRELFDTLLLWRGRVPIGADGRAVVEVPLGDSLSSFRIAAVATAGTNLFGTGSASIRTAQDLMVLPGLPPVVRQGDLFGAHFTVRNTTTRRADVALAAQVEGLERPPAPIATTLAAGEARELTWEVTAPAGADALRWDVTVTANGEAGDRLRVSQRVAPAVPVRVFQATLAQLDPQVEVPVAAPAGALPGGGIEIAVRPKLGDGLAGVERRLRSYPYGCLEQKISRAVGLRDAALWQEIVDSLPALVDDEGLARFFPSIREGSPVLTAYLLAIADESGLAIPERQRAAMLAGLERFVAGEITRDALVPAPDLALRKLAALEALARSGRVRPELLGAIRPTPASWPTSALLDWIGIVRRTRGLPDGARQLRRARDELRARLVLQGTTLSFSTERSDDLYWLLATPDTNAARALLDALAEKRPPQDVARLARGALARQRSGVWDSTMADAWGAVAIGRFSAAHESAAVSGAIESTLSGVTRRQAWNGAAALTERFGWPASPAQLRLRQDGPGRPWAMIQGLASVPLAKPVSSGFTVSRSVRPLQQKQPGRLSRGDVVEVTLEATAQSDAGWVVVRDPLPPGATVLGGGLGGGSLVASATDAAALCPCPVSTERSAEALTRYYEWVPAGPFRSKYVVALTQDGRFGLPPARVEAMYVPEMYAEVPIEPLVVAP